MFFLSHSAALRFQPAGMRVAFTEANKQIAQKAPILQKETFVSWGPGEKIMFTLKQKPINIIANDYFLRCIMDVSII